MSIKIDSVRILPRVFDILRPSDYRSMRNFGTKEPLNLHVPVMKRFPMQPDWPAVHPHLTEHPQTGKPQVPTGDLWMTDKLLWTQYLTSSLENDEKQRVLNRFAVERNEAQRQTTWALLEQSMWQQFYFKRQAANIKELIYLIELGNHVPIRHMAPDWGFVMTAYGKHVLSPLDDRGKPFSNHVVLPGGAIKSS